MQNASISPIVHSHDPYNAEPPLALLRSSFVTAQADLYVRSHGTVPTLDAATHRLEVTGRVAARLDLSLAELRQRFPEVTVRAVMQCAGNRRADLDAVAEVTGDPWAPGAIGNADWTGVRLADVLSAAGVGADLEAADLHVAFSSLDECEIEGEPVRFGASIPLAKAMAPEVLLAYAMNGEPLAPRHGHPLRVVVPGFAGVRSAKWLARIEVRDTPSDNPIQARDYKMLPPDITDPEVIDWSRGSVINEMPVNAAICEPAPHASLSAGVIVARGYAIATGRAITRVDVSSDGGRRWTQARLQSEPAAPWSWTLWEADLQVAAGAREIVVRAWDAAGQTQPAIADDMWNIKGYLSAAWHRVPVTIVA